MSFSKRFFLFSLIVTCRGYAGSSSIQTFDGKSFNKFCTCSHVLAKDTFGLDFEISVQREKCNDGNAICTKSLTISDKVNDQTYTISKDQEIVRVTRYINTGYV